MLSATPAAGWGCGVRCGCRAAGRSTAQLGELLPLLSVQSSNSNGFRVRKRAPCSHSLLATTSRQGQSGLQCRVVDLATEVLTARAHGRGMYLVPKLPNWSCLLVFVHADPMALLLLTLCSGRTGISARSGHLQGESGGTEGEGMAWSSDGTRALQGCREIRNQC